MNFSPALIFQLQAGESAPRKVDVTELAELCGAASTRFYEPSTKNKERKA